MKRETHDTLCDLIVSKSLLISKYLLRYIWSYELAVNSGFGVFRPPECLRRDRWGWGFFSCLFLNQCQKKEVFRIFCTNLCMVPTRYLCQRITLKWFHINFWGIATCPVWLIKRSYLGITTCQTFTRDDFTLVFIFKKRLDGQCHSSYSYNLTSLCLSIFDQFI